MILKFNGGLADFSGLSGLIESTRAFNPTAVIDIHIENDFVEFSSEKTRPESDAEGTLRRAGIEFDHVDTKETGETGTEYLLVAMKELAVRARREGMGTLANELEILRDDWLVCFGGGGNG